MANKYAHQAKQARIRRKGEMKRLACERKKAFDSEEAARYKGQRTYKCEYCQKWHRTSYWHTY